MGGACAKAYGWTPKESGAPPRKPGHEVARAHQDMEQDREDR